MKLSQAQYRVSIPAADNLGQRISPNFPVAAHHWLYHAHPGLFSGSWIEGPHKGMWQEDAPEDFYHLVTTTDDCPEADSHIKQLAKHVAHAANQWGVYAQKNGENGVEKWMIDNPEYVEGQGAHPSILEVDPALSGAWSPTHPDVNVPTLPYVGENDVVTSR